MREYEYAIIGNSAAAAGCIEGIRRVTDKGRIAVISREAHHIYSRPLISYLLLGKTDTERMKYRPDDFYEKNGCDTFFGAEAVKIIPDEKKIILADGSSICYNKMLNATGSTPFLPHFDGIETVEERFSFMTLDDALALSDSLKEKKRVLIVGAGLIGLKCAEGISGIADSVTAVDLSKKVLSSILDDESSERLKKHIESKGISLKLGRSVSRFDGKKAFLDNGEELDFDVLVTAVGVRPAISLLADAGAETGRGIKTDDRMKTTLPDIYAAGDCTESFDISCGESRVLAILPNAYLQGETAGMNMAGEEKHFDNSIPMNAISFFGLHIITAGSYRGEVCDLSENGSIKKLFCENDRLAGYILLGSIDKAGVYTSLIRNGVPLDSIDFQLISEHPSLMAFSKKYRDEKLGGKKK